MKTNSIRTKQTKGFTLIEMIGVLAVIAILAALLIPKVFQAITEAKINTVPVGAATVKTAVIDHYAKWGGLANGSTGTILTTLPTADTPVAGYDELVLMAGGFLDKPFAPRVGTSADIQLSLCGLAATAVDGTTPGLYNLDGIGTANDAVGTYVVEAKIIGVPRADAQAISARIDGAALSITEAQISTDTADDLLGRVRYDNGTDPTTVYIYITHR